MDVSQENDLVKVMLCSIRSYEEIVHLDPNDLKDDVIADFELTDESEIFIKRKNRRQFYDVITIDKSSGIIQVRLDWGHGMKQRDARRVLLQTKKFFESFSSETLDVALQLDAPINLFPLVDALYQSDIGRVCELGFTVNSGSVKSEKLRRHDTDIRSEDFHRGGREAVDGQLSPYRLALIWTFRGGNSNEARPELLLPGNKTSLSDPDNKPLHVALITRCFYESDFLSISGTLLNNLISDEE